MIMITPKMFSSYFLIDAPRSAREDGGGGNHVEVRAEIGAEKVLSVNVSANPKPDSVTWTVDGKTLREKESTDKFEALELVAQGVSLQKIYITFFSPILQFE